MKPGRATWAAITGLLIALGAWLWPIGVGGAMPVGGDVTRFFLGLMAVLGESYRAGRLPLWNDLWGFGFPGLAESQMGVFYPPHLLLYGLLHTTAAYTASLVLHTAWAALGAFWAARRFGASPLGAAFGAFAWSASGFFIIHLPHQWGYTVGSWMPWALGLAWPLARGAGAPRDALKLAAVLTLQVLPGHFQLAFITQVSVLILAAWGLLERPAGRARALRGAAGISSAVGAVLLLGAMQLLPTWELARLAGAKHDYEYLSGFALPPTHLVGFVAPALFHIMPFWRRVAWDPFHTSPEEVLPYIGLLPLFLAIQTLGRTWRHDAATRALGVMALVSLVLAMGPYVPGFSSLIELPGFSFFRAPARWSLATLLALSMLAGKGLEGIWRLEPERLRLGVYRFAAVAALGVLVCVLAFEFVVWAAYPSEPQTTALAALGRLYRLLPWEQEAPFRSVAEAAVYPIHRARSFIYLFELGASAAILFAITLVAALRWRRPSQRAVILVGLTVFDLFLFGHLLRPVASSPLRPIEAASPVMAHLARSPRGVRLLSDLGNLPMAAGAAALPPYRTLDRPVGVDTRSAGVPSDREVPDRVRFARRSGFFDTREYNERFAAYLEPLLERNFASLGISLQLVWEHFQHSPWLAGLEAGRVVRFRDPVLVSWLSDHAPGREWVGDRLAGYPIVRNALHITTSGPRGKDPALDMFSLVRPRAAQPTAWLDQRPLRDLLAASPRSDPAAFLRRDAWPTRARGLRIATAAPERLAIDLVAEEPATVVLSILDDPEWAAVWTGASGVRPATIHPILRGGPGSGGWMAVEVPEPGRWTLHLTYRGRAAYRGLAVSGVAWVAWLLAYWWSGRRRVPGGIETRDGLT